MQVKEDNKLNATMTSRQEGGNPAGIVAFQTRVIPAGNHKYRKHGTGYKKKHSLKES